MEAISHETVKSEFFVCDCYAHGISVQEDIDLYDNDAKYSQGFYFSYWHYGHPSGYKPKTFLQKIKYAWRVLRKGDLNTDSIILNPDEAKRLGEFLLEKVKNPTIEIKQKD